MIKTADLVIDPQRRQLSRGKHVLKLPNLSFQTLMALIEAAPEQLSTDQLIEQVWQGVEVSPETVTQRIALLRKVLASPGVSSDSYIASIRNQGYRWVPEVKIANSQRWQWPATIAVLLGLLIISTLALKSPNQTSLTTAQTSASQKSFSAAASEDDFVRQAWHYLGKHEAKSNQLAIDLFHKALASNPQHLNALTGLSIALSHEVSKYNQADELLIEAKQAAETALAINPKHAQAVAALAFFYDASGQMNQAIAYYEQALELDPGNSSIASSVAYLYGQRAQLVKAMQLNVSALGSQQLYLNLQIAHVLDLLGFDLVAEQWYKKADELSPDNVFVTHTRSRFYLSRNQYQKAREVVDSAFKRGIERPDLHVVSALLYWINQDIVAAKTAAQKGVETDRGDLESQLLLLLLSYPDGVPEERQTAFVAQWFGQLTDWPELGVYQAMFYAYHGDEQQALQGLEQAFQAGYRNHRWLSQLPPLHQLKSTVEWSTLMEAMQADVSRQKQELLQVDWLPAGFLDPLTY